MPDEQRKYPPGVISRCDYFLCESSDRRFQPTTQGLHVRSGLLRSPRKRCGSHIFRAAKSHAIMDSHTYRTSVQISVLSRSSLIH